ncbi:hypothetical protein CL618_02410 [archaeon]|nr:hypothetical protein [archaeon]
MPEKDYVIVPWMKIKQSSTFSLDELYKMMYYWFERHDYVFKEKEYAEQRTQGSKLYEIRWYAERKVTDYIKFVIEVGLFFSGIKDVEVEKDGGKMKTQGGTVEMRFSAHLRKDYEGNWESSPVLKMIRGMYDKYIIGSRIEGYEDDLYEETYDLMNEVKAFLNMHKFG